MEGVFDDKACILVVVEDGVGKNDDDPKMMSEYVEKMMTRMLKEASSEIALVLVAFVVMVIFQN